MKLQEILLSPQRIGIPNISKKDYKLNIQL